MKDLKFRTLNADEIECRIQSTKNGVTRLLTYIDSRAVVTLLNETVGAMNWQTSFTEVNGLTICNLAIWDDEKHIWVSKADTGAESNIEAQKGLISDSYKRCLARWGCTALYSAPVIELPGENKWEKYRVTNIDYDGEYADSHITKLTIVDSKGRKVFDWNLNDGITYKTDKPNDAKPTAKNDDKVSATTDDDLRNFFKAVKNKAEDWEKVKPCITGFVEYYRNKLPINNIGGAWKSWVKREKDNEIREACQKTA